MSIIIKGWTDNGEKDIKIMNRVGIATPDEDMWPQVTDKPLSKVKLRLRTRIPKINLTSNLNVAGKEFDVHFTAFGNRRG
jgi:hypothetical protein